jgi:hypothetical protein
VVLTVASGPAPVHPSSAVQSVAQIAKATGGAKATAVKSKGPILISGLRRTTGPGETLRPIAIAEWGHFNANLGGGSERNNLRSWEPIPAVHAWPVASTPMSRAENESPVHRLPVSDLRIREGQPGAAPLTGRMGMSNIRREPVRILTPMLPRIGR